MKVTNVCSNKVFPESFVFKCWKPSIFELVDLNKEGSYDSVVFNPNEIRSFIYMLTPHDKETYKINKFTAE